MLQVRRDDGSVETLLFEWFEEEVRAGTIDDGSLLCFQPATGEDFVPAQSLELYRSVAENLVLSSSVASTWVRGLWVH